MQDTPAPTSKQKRKPFEDTDPRYYWGLGCLILLLGFIVILTFRTGTTWESGFWLRLNPETGKLQPERPKDIEAIGNSGNHEMLLRNLDQRIRTNEELRGNLSTNLKLQGMVIAIVICVYWIRLAETHDDNGIESKQLLTASIPSNVIPVLLTGMPLVMLYLWQEFGYLLFDMIENRRILVAMIGSLDHTPAGSVFSAKLMLADNYFILDPWFEVFGGPSSQAYIARKSHYVMGLAKVLGYCAFLGASHACMILPIPEACRCGKNRYLRQFGIIYLVCVTVFVGMTHFEFRDAGHNNNWAQILIISFAIIITLFVEVARPPASPPPKRPSWFALYRAILRLARGRGVDVQRQRDRSA